MGTRVKKQQASATSAQVRKGGSHEIQRAEAVDSYFLADALRVPAFELAHAQYAGAVDHNVQRATVSDKDVTLGKTDAVVLGERARLYLFPAFERREPGIGERRPIDRDRPARPSPRIPAPCPPRPDGPASRISTSAI
jgi:hypothetical protein